MPRTQSERSAATQLALRTAARRLWGARGYENVGTPEIAEAAGVTRGAMYHQYADKQALFRAVVEMVQDELIGALVVRINAEAPASPAVALHRAADAWLQIATEAEIRQLVLIDAPRVLGWATFRDISLSSSLGVTEALLSEAIDAGELRPQPTRPLATILLGALDEAVMSIAHADDPAAERAALQTVIHDLIDGLLIAPLRAGPRTAPGC